MKQLKMRKVKTVLVVALAVTIMISCLVIYYLIPSEKIPEGVTIDRILVYKSRHELQAFSNSKLIVTYKIAIGKNAIGAKEYQGDLKTPEGMYTINDRNPNSGYHKNLGISYPNKQDVFRAKTLGRPTGGDIKIHGLRNGGGHVGKFHRWTDWTNGCIALDNAEMDELYDHVALGAPIEIRK
jgi:murein L,D-transpeptidase YafK